MIIVSAVIDGGFENKTDAALRASGEFVGMSTFTYLNFIVVTSWLFAWNLHSQHKAAHVALANLSFVSSVVTFGWACKSASSDGSTTGSTTEAGTAFTFLSSVLTIIVYLYLTLGGGDSDLAIAAGGGGAPKAAQPVVVSSKADTEAVPA